jgi:hypothetical protein
MNGGKCKDQNILYLDFRFRIVDRGFEPCFHLICQILFSMYGML